MSLIQPRFNGLRNFHFIQSAKYTKIEIHGQAALKMEGIVEQPFANIPEKLEYSSHKVFKKMKCVTHRFLQPSQQKSKIVIKLSRKKKTWRILLSNGMNACVTHERSTRFLRTLYQQKHCQLGF